MRTDDIDVLFDYMYWANHKLLSSASRLAQDRFMDKTTVTTRDLRATLVHELDVEWSWRQNLRGRIGPDDGELDPAEYPDVESLREHWHRDEAEMRQWLGSLSDADLTEGVYSTFTDEQHPMWVFLMHIVTHAGQQQADAATLLSLAGQSPGELTFLEYFASR
jgi:uncharacterized damage-inducible protein DinB